jgi:hypothetical protein
MAESYEYRDALPNGPARGRGAGLNPGNRYETTRLHVLGEYLDEQAQVSGQARTYGRTAPEEAPLAGATSGAAARTQVLPDRTKTLINPVASPDVPYSWSINPYRGCEHGWLCSVNTPR